MSWFIQAILSAISFTFMLLIFRWLGDKGMKESVILFYVFCFGTFFFLVNSIKGGRSLNIGLPLIGVLLLATVFSFIGNTYHVKALISAPNPGYADAVLSFKVLLLTGLSILLLGSAFSLLKLVGIVLTIGGIILLGIR